MIDLRLFSQQLSSTKCKTPQELVSWMGAMQAQDFNMAKWAIGIRLTRYTNHLVEAAFNRGEILRTHVLRPTWHFVSPENIRWMLPLTAQKIISSMKSRDRDLGLTEEFYAKSYSIIEKALEGKHLTREELMVAFEKNRLPINTSQLYHLMMRAESNGMVCSGAMHGKKHTYALLDERVPPTKPLAKDEALAKLARIYFTGHSPATLQDFIWWSGLSATEAKQGLEAAKPDLISEKVNEQTYWGTDIFGKKLISSKSVYLLPAFDEYIIAYRDRKAVLDSENHSKAISSNGIFRPTILYNGKVIGLWKKTASKNSPVALEFFSKVDKPVQKLVDQAVDNFSLFLSKA